MAGLRQAFCGVIVMQRKAGCGSSKAFPRTIFKSARRLVLMPQEMRLQGKKALITGSDTGIGHEIGLEFAPQGADVVFHYVQTDSGVKAAVEEVKSLGRRSAAFQAESDALDQVTGLADQAGELLGGVNCLVNNAGVTMNRPFLKVTPEQFDKLFHINFRGQYFLIERIVQDMLQRGGGVICNMSSVHGLRGCLNIPFMRRRKAQSLLTRDLWPSNWPNKGIRVNANTPVGSPWRTILSAFPALPKKSRRKPATKPFRWHAAENPWILPSWRLSCVPMTRRSLSAKPSSPTAEPRRSCLLVSDFRKESTNTFGRGYIPGV